MDSLHEVEQNSLLRGVGPRQASIKANQAAVASGATGGAGTVGGSHVKSVNKRSSKRAHHHHLLAPLGGSHSPPSLLATAATTPVSAVTIPHVLTSRQLFSGELSEEVTNPQFTSNLQLSLSHQAHFIGQIWRETRNYTRKQQEAQLAQAQALAEQWKSQKKTGKQEEEKTMMDMKGHHRPSFSPMHSLTPTSTTLPTLPPAPETLSSIDSLLNPHSIVHVAAALSVEQMQREELTRQASGQHRASQTALQTANTIAHQHQLAVPQYGPQHMAQQSQIHSNSHSLAVSPSSSSINQAMSPRVRNSYQSLHMASSQRFNSAALAASPSTSGQSNSLLPSPTTAQYGPSNPITIGHHGGYLDHILSHYNAWQHQLAFMAQDIFAGKCADLGLQPTYERRDKFISRILESGAQDGILRLQAQGLGRASARAIVGFLRRVQAFAAPTDQERMDRASKYGKSGGSTHRGAWNLKKHLHHMRHGSHSSNASPGQSEPNSDSDSSSDEHEDGAVQELIDQEEFLKRSLQSTQASALNSPAGIKPTDSNSAITMNPATMTISENFSFEPLNSDGFIVTSLTPTMSNSDLKQGVSVSQFISDLHNSKSPSATTGASGAQGRPGLTLDTSPRLGAIGEDATIASPFEPQFSPRNGESVFSPHAPPLPLTDLQRVRRLLGFQRKYFHALDLTGNHLGDDGALELCVLFLPNPKQLAAEAEKAALAHGTKTERRRLKREKKLAKEKANALGMDLLNGSDESDTLYPLSGLKTLILRSNNLSSQGFALLFDSMAHKFAPLVSLDLSANSAVSSNAVLPSVHGSGTSSGGAIGLGNMFIGLEGCHSLGNLLLKNVQLLSLSLQNVGIGTIPNGLEFIAAGIKENKTLATFDLSSNRIAGNSEFSNFTSALKSSAITHLNLSHNPIGSLGASYIATYISSTTTLSKLHLDSCQLTVGGLALISHSLETSVNLNDLILDGNDLIGRGLEKDNQFTQLARILVQRQLNHICVSPQLAANLSLHTLHLNNSNIDDKTAIELSACLHGHSTVHTLLLRSNRISDEGGQALGQLLRMNKSLNQLDLYMNFIGDIGGVAIARACASGSSINFLNMQNNKLTNTTGEFFISALGHNPGLAHLALDGNAIDYRIYHKLEEGVKRNKQQYDRTVLPKQYALIRRLLRDKAKFNEVSLERDSAALQDRRNSEYLADLSAGLKSFKNAELTITEDLQLELNKYKLENLDLQSQLRGLNASLSTAGNKRESKLHELQSQLNQERAQAIILRKKLRKGTETLGINSGVILDKKGQPLVDVERTNVETILRLETRKLETARTDTKQLGQDLEAFIATLEKALEKQVNTTTTTNASIVRTRSPQKAQPKEQASKSRRNSITMADTERTLTTQ